MTILYYKEAGHPGGSSAAHIRGEAIRAWGGLWGGGHSDLRSNSGSPTY